jgi:hypothetical protein
MTFQNLTEAEIGLLAEGLHRLREIKGNAHAEIVKMPGHERFTPRDFGIPAIDALLEKLDVAMMAL